MKRSILSLVRAAVVVAGVAFMVLALVRAAQNPELTVLPSPGPSMLALAAIVTGLWGGATAWARLLDRPIGRGLARGFFTAQFGKYVPGGIWQAVGQITDATARVRVEGSTAAAAFVASAVVTIAAGLTVSATIVLLPTVPMWARAATPVAAVAAMVLLSHPDLIVGIARRIGPLRRRLEAVTLPDRRQLLRAWAWTLPSMLAAGFVYAIALRATTGELVPEALPVFVAAWTIGFLALPIPAGLGVREAVLVLFLPAQDPVALVAASAIVRLAYIVGEALAVATTLGATPAPSTDAAASTDPEAPTEAG